jgi:hypothetical protein
MASLPNPLITVINGCAANVTGSVGVTSSAELHAASAIDAISEARRVMSARAWNGCDLKSMRQIDAPTRGDAARPQHERLA